MNETATLTPPVTITQTASLTVTPTSNGKVPVWDVLNSSFVDVVLLVGIIGALCGRFVLDPYIAYKKTIRDIDSSFILYANSFVRSVPLTMKTASPIIEHFRRLASDFASNYRQVPFRGLLIFMKAIPSQKQMQEVQEGLILLSNSVGDTPDPHHDPHKTMRDLRKILKIQT